MKPASLLSLSLVVVASSGCGPDVEGPAAAGATSGLPDSSCVSGGGRCVSLDLPSCGLASVPVDRVCDDPGTRCCDPAEDNGTCAAALPIELVDATITIEADTSTATDEHPDLTCDSHQVAFSLSQGQLYYRFGAVAGKQYLF